MTSKGSVIVDRNRFYSPAFLVQSHDEPDNNTSAVVRAPGVDEVGVDEVGIHPVHRTQEDRVNLEAQLLYRSYSSSGPERGSWSFLKVHSQGSGTFFHPRKRL